MSLFTSLAFSIALYLAFVERQIRWTQEGQPLDRRFARSEEFEPPTL
jgi:hypothetical protein